MKNTRGNTNYERNQHGQTEPQKAFMSGELKKIAARFRHDYAWFYISKHMKKCILHILFPFLSKN